MTNNSKTQQSFTLIELLVVIAIIGILAGIAIPAFQGATERAQIAKGLQFSDSLRNSLMINLISEWKFDDYLTDPHSTTAKDSWAKYNANTGTLVNFNFTDPNSGWRTGSNCVSGSCLQFDGIDDYVDCGSNASLNIPSAITMEAWIKRSSTGYDLIFGKGGAYLLGFGSNKIYFNFYNGTGWTGSSFSNTIVTDSNWHHIVATYDKNRGTVQVFLDGSMDAETSKGSQNINQSSIPLYIGYIQGWTSEWYFNGSIDEVRIYNAALPQAMIQQHYVQGLNSMLANKSISYEEYSQRMSEISSNLAIK